MAPKTKASGKSPARKIVRVVDKNVRPEVKFLKDITPDSPPKDIAKLTANMQSAFKKEDEEMLQAGLDAIQRLCASGTDSNGIISLLKAEGVETVAFIAVEGTVKPIKLAAQDALASMYRRACQHLDSIEKVDFTEVPNVLFMGNAVGCFEEDCALSTLAAMERLAVHRVDYALALLHGGAMQIIHLYLSSHRAPELCHECLTVLFRLCDGPGDFFVQYLLDEREIVLTIVETLNDAPLNMRLQIAGLRLFCLWNQPEVFPEDMEFADKEDAMLKRDEVRQEMRRAGVSKALRRVLQDLTRSGLRHQAAWIHSLSSGFLAPAELKPRISEVRPLGFFSSM